MPEKHFLRQMQALPLSAKVMKSQLRIREWYEHFGGDVCVSFSGGKDSTVLAHLVRGLYPDVPLVFANTGLEYPEIQEFARKMGAEFIYPKMRFDEVISKYGYPIISKENSEAIYYARRIRNSEHLDDNTDKMFGGGWTSKRKLSDQKRNELGGTRTFDSENSKNVRGGGTRLPETLRHRSAMHDQYIWNRNEWQISADGTHLERKVNGADENRSVMTGCGATGDEKQSPG